MNFNTNNGNIENGYENLQNKFSNNNNGINEVEDYQDDQDENDDDNNDDIDDNMQNENDIDDNYNDENNEGEEYEDNDNYDQDEKSQNRHSERVNTNASEISFHFACMKHPSEEYAYYSPSLKMLFCAQCLLSDPEAQKCQDIRSLRRSFPLIMQHFQDLLNDVEVNRSLLENRMKDSEIKTDDIRSKMNSLKNFVELRFDELIDSVNDVKNNVIRQKSNDLTRVTMMTLCKFMAVSPEFLQQNMPQLFFLILP